MTSGGGGAAPVAGRALDIRAHIPAPVRLAGAAGRVYFAITGPLHHLSALPLLSRLPSPLLPGEAHARARAEAEAQACACGSAGPAL